MIREYLNRITFSKETGHKKIFKLAFFVQTYSQVFENFKNLAMKFEPA